MGVISPERFFQPSLPFNLIFGLTFGILQALLITAASLLFGRERIKWTNLIGVLISIGLVEFGFGLFGAVRPLSALRFIGLQTLFILGTAALMQLGRVWLKDWWRLAGGFMVAVSLAVGLLGYMNEPDVLQLAWERTHW